MLRGRFETVDRGEAGGQIQNFFQVNALIMNEPAKSSDFLSRRSK